MKKPVILIIDDDPKLNRTLSDILVSKGYECMAAATGAQGLSVFKQRQVNLVILDLQLPDVSGLELLREMKSEKPRAEVIVITGYAGLETAVDATERGAFSYLPKPYDMDRLLIIIKRAVEKQRADDLLRKREESFRKVFLDCPIGMGIICEDYKFLKTNSMLLQMLGCREEELISKRFTDFLVAEEIRENAESFDRLLSGDIAVYRKERRIMRQDGERIWTSLTVSVIRDDEDYHQFLVMMEDITERKEAEDRLKRLLNEKEMLLREIHHRVKNNLQIISSILNLQSQSIQEQYVLNLFRESRNRIKSMAFIHERLYQGGDLTGIDLSEYICKIGQNLMSSYRPSSSDLCLRVDASSAQLDIDRAVSCGLIINELVSNSLKHAFPGRSGGEIGISLKMDAGGAVLLAVSDNGTGFPDEVDFRNVESLGLQLVNLLTDQLGGAVELVRGAGTQFRISFHAPVKDLPVLTRTAG